MTPEQLTPAGPRSCRQQQLLRLSGGLEKRAWIKVSISSQAYTSSFEALSAVDFCHFPGCLSCHRDPGRFGFPIAWESASSDEDELWEAKESGLISQSSMSFMTGRIDPTLLLPSGQGVRPGVLSGCLYLMFLSGRQKPVLDTWDFFPSSKKLSP